MQYSDFQNQVSSEKIVLSILEPSKQLIGWELHSGSVYKLTGFAFPVISSIKDSGNAYTEVGSIGAVTASKYYLDQATQTLYLRTTGSDNPNGRFIVATVKLFYSNVPIALPHDLNTGFEVFFEPLIKDTSNFGVEIDTINQTSEAIEGAGTLTLTNDQDFFPKNFDKISFENSDCRVWSYNRKLPVTEARLIFSGKIEVKKYNSQTVQFQLKDLLNQLRTSVNLGTIADLNQRTSPNLNSAKQRLVLGRVFGHRPVNTDSVLDGYPITGLVSIDFGDGTLTGSGTLFLKEFSPDDRIVLNGDEYTIATVDSNTSLTLTEGFNSTATIVNGQAYVIPEKPKRWMNRTWHLAGHALRQPTTLTLGFSTITRLFVEDTTDFYPGDWIYIGPFGSGELAQVDVVRSSQLLILKTSLASVPGEGEIVTRPCVQNVRINNTFLTYGRDYSVDPDAATLTLEETAEANASQIRYLNTDLTFTNGSRIVTGDNIKINLQVGYMVGIVGQAIFHEILSIDSDTQLTLRTAPSFSETDTGRYKPLVFNPESSVLSADMLGRTDDGTSTGNLPKSAPGIVKMLLADLGLQSQINITSFDESEDLAPFHLGVVFPDKFNSTSETVYRDIFNILNKSVFGNLIQDNNFLLKYDVLYPNKSTGAKRLTEADCLDFKFDSVSDKLVKTAIVQYKPQEYDPSTGTNLIHTEQKTSDVANYLKKATETRTFVTKIVNEKDARRIVNRWAFILENGSGKCTITTKLQTMDMEIGEVIYLSHVKLFERYGTNLKARLFLIEKADKSGADVSLELVDLSNAFTRVCGINDLTVEFDDASDEQKLFGGFYTDSYGLINNNPNSYGVNLIW